MDITDWESLDS